MRRLPGPTIPGRPLPTPFGEIHLPRMEPLKLERPTLDERKMRAVRHALAGEIVSFLAGFVPIPYVGGLVAGQIGDLHSAEVADILTPVELRQYMEADKRIPSNTLAMLYSFIK